MHIPLQRLPPHNTWYWCLCARVDRLDTRRGSPDDLRLLVQNVGQTLSPKFSSHSKINLEHLYIYSINGTSELTTHWNRYMWWEIYQFWDYKLTVRFPAIFKSWKSTSSQWREWEGMVSKQLYQQTDIVKSMKSVRLLGAFKANFKMQKLRYCKGQLSKLIKIFKLVLSFRYLLLKLMRPYKQDSFLQLPWGFDLFGCRWHAVKVPKIENWHLISTHKTYPGSWSGFTGEVEKQNCSYNQCSNEDQNTAPLKLEHYFL